MGTWQVGLGTVSGDRGLEQGFLLQPPNLPNLSALGRASWVAVPGAVLATLRWDAPPAPRGLRLHLTMACLT